MALISVIIPAYNVEKYLRECLDSVVNQTYKNLEIICVNDGSTDSTPDILREYESKDDRIKVIDQENKGLSGARNTGLRHCKGDYVYFIDSDDYIEADAMEKLHDISEEKSLDCVIFKLINFDDDTNEKFETEYYNMDFLKESVEDKVFSHRDISEDIFRVAVSIPGKFFKRDLIKDMEFVEGIIFEDNPFFVEVLFKAEKLYFLDEYLYNRRVREDSIITSTKNFTDYITVSNMMGDIAKKYGLYDEYKGPFYEKTIYNTFLRLNQVNDEDKKEFFLKMKEDYQSKKDEYVNDEAFKNIDPRIREIYCKCIEADTAKELELYLEVYDLNVKLEENIEIKNQYNRERLKLFHRSHELSSKLNELANENRELKKDN